VSLYDLHQRLKRLGPDKLIEATADLRIRLDHLRRDALARLPEDGGYGLTLDQMHEAMTKMEELIVDMQTSCVRLPAADHAWHESWEVPVRTESFLPLLSDYMPGTHLRIWRIRFELDRSGETYKWKLPAFEFDTGIPVRLRP